MVPHAGQVCALGATLRAEMRRRAQDGERIKAHLTIHGKKSPVRRRGVPVYVMELELSWLPDMGRVLLVDELGYPHCMTLTGAADWLMRSMPGRAVSLEILMSNALELSPVWTMHRQNAVQSKAQAVNFDALIAAAQEKRATVQTWAGSARRDEVLAASLAIEWAQWFSKEVEEGAGLGAVRPDWAVPLPE